MASPIDLWIQRAVVGAMLVLALGLVTFGLLLYAPHASPPAAAVTLAH